MQLQTYLYLNGRCEEALAFYAKTLGAETLFLLRFKDAPESRTSDPAWQDKIMHSTFRVGGVDVLASDGMPGGPPQAHSGYSLSITASDAAAGEKLFGELAAGGTVQMPWQAAFWTKGFGMATDRFGVPWMVSVEHGDTAQS
jgi:PhnB protein